MKKSLKILLPILIICIVGSAYYNLTKPTKINSFIASKIYKTPANKAFTDENFYKCVVDSYNDKNGTSVAYTENLTDEQLKTITQLNCSGLKKSDDEKIISVNGLEKLEFLQTLDVSYNLIENIDISNLKTSNLRELYANDNKLLEIKFSNDRLMLLWDVKLQNNSLTNIDLSHLSFLKYINLCSNKINELDVSKNKSLVDLWISNNQIKKLDISKNTKLEWLWADINEISQIDLSNNTELNFLSLRNNKISSIDTSNNLLLNQIDISNSVSKNLNKNSVKNLNLKNNKILYSINAANVGLEEIIFPEIDLDFAYNYSQENITFQEFVDINMWGLEVNLSSNKLTNIDLSTLPTLEELMLGGNDITELDVSKNFKLKVLSYGFNSKAGLTSIDVTNNTLLEKLDLQNNKLVTIDLNKNTNLLKLNLYGNKLANIDLSNNILLEELDLMNNEIRKLDISKNTNLKTLTLMGSSYRQVLAVYKGDTFDFSVDPGAIKFPQGFTTSYVSMSSNQRDSSLIDGTTITPNGVSIINFVKYVYIKDERNMGSYEVSYILYNIELDSDEYVVKGDYIYVPNNNLDVNKVKILTNGNILPDEIKIDLIKDNDKLQVYQGERLIKELNIIGINFGNLKTGKNFIQLTEDVSYDEFINNITVSEGLMYKIFNGETEITEGNISKGMNLKVYQGEELVATYEITDEYLDLSLLNVDDDKKLIKDLVIGTKVSEFKDKISTTGNITVVDKDNEILTDDKLIASGSKVKIELTNETYEYTLSVRGDVTGNGQAKMADVMKIATHIIEGNVIKGEAFEMAADITGDGKIKMNDVMKLATFIIDGGRL